MKALTKPITRRQAFTWKIGNAATGHGTASSVRNRSELSKARETSSLACVSTANTISTRATYALGRRLTRGGNLYDAVAVARTTQSRFALVVWIDSWLHGKARAIAHTVVSFRARNADTVAGCFTAASVDRDAAAARICFVGDRAVRQILRGSKVQTCGDQHGDGDAQAKDNGPLHRSSRLDQARV